MLELKLNSKWNFLNFFWCFTSCACKRSWKLQRSKSATTFLLKCLVRNLFFNSVTMSNNFTINALQLVWHIQINLAALLLLVVRAQMCVGWPIRAGWGFQYMSIYGRECMYMYVMLCKQVSSDGSPAGVGWKGVISLEATSRARGYRLPHLK